VKQLRRYEAQCARAGLDKMHGLRHAYAQERFLELAGFACPAAGGPSREQLTPAQREADYDARVLISAELGHGREQITAAYLGRSAAPGGAAAVCTDAAPRAPCDAQARWRPRRP
jgi:hypothetical protein